MIDWGGGVPDWLAGVGAITALYFAYRAVRAVDAQNRSQSQQLAILVKDHAKKVEQERLEQASKISLMIIWRPLPKPIFEHSTAGKAVWDANDSEAARRVLDQLYILNKSDLPIYMVQIHAGPIHIGYSALPPTPEPLHVSETATVAFNPHWRPIARAREMFGDRLTGVAFTDAHGRYWTRSLDGKLEEQEDGMDLNYWNDWTQLADEPDPEHDGT